MSEVGRRLGYARGRMLAPVPSLAARPISDAFGVRGPFFTSAGRVDEAPTEGEPCGSGEDGGPLVCQPFSG